MAVGRFYSDNTEVNVGAPTLGRFMATYFDEIKSMNDAALAYEQADDGTDAADLDKMEIAARERFAKMAEALQEAKSGDFRSTNDLMRTVIEGGVSERNKMRDVSAEMAGNRLQLRSDYRKISADEQDEFRRKTATKPETDAAIDGFAAIVRNDANEPTSAVTEKIVQQLRQFATAEKAGGESDPKFVAMVVRALNAVKDEPRGAEIAQQVQQQVLPDSVRRGQTAGDYLMQIMPPTRSQVDEEAERVIRETGGAGARGSMIEDIRSVGGDPNQIGKMAGVSESTSTKTKGGGGSAAPVREGGSVSMEGMSPDAIRAYQTASAGGSDPYAAMLAAMEAQQAYIADVAARRKEAAAKGRPSLYPRPNAYTVSPNRMVPEAVQRSIRAVGNMDPGRFEEWDTALARSGGNIDRAYKEMGGTPERRYSVKDYAASEFEDGGGLGALIADNLTVSAAPHSTTSEGVDSPLTGTMKMIKALPKEVRDLFGESVIYAENGKYDEAIAAARAVSDDDVRAAFGTSLRRASDDPKALAEVMNGLAGLPESVTGEWGGAVRDAIDDHTRSVPKVGARADEVLRGNLDRLGGALEGSGVSKAKRARKEEGEQVEKRADEQDRAAYEQGQRAVLDALDTGHDYETVGMAWDKAPDSAVKRGAWDALQDVSGTGVETLRRKITKEIGPAPEAQTYTVRPGTKIETPDVKSEIKIEEDDPFVSFAAEFKTESAPEEDPFESFAKEFK